jgi:hypothetical protein
MPKAALYKDADAAGRENQVWLSRQRALMEHIP